MTNCLMSVLYLRLSYSEYRIPKTQCIDFRNGCYSLRSSWVPRRGLVSMHFRVVYTCRIVTPSILLLEEWSEACPPISFTAHNGPALTVILNRGCSMSIC